MQTMAIVSLFIVAILQDNETPGDFRKFLGHMTKEDIEIVEYMYYASLKARVEPEKSWKLAWCESQFEPRGGDYSTITMMFESWGLLQFQRPTFDYLSRDSGIVGPYEDSYTQIDLTLWTINNDKKGIGHWWTCGHRAGFYDREFVLK